MATGAGATGAAAGAGVTGAAGAVAARGVTGAAIGAGGAAGAVGITTAGPTGAAAAAGSAGALTSSEARPTRRLTGVKAYKFFCQPLEIHGSMKFDLRLDPSEQDDQDSRRSGAF